MYKFINENEKQVVSIRQQLINHFVQGVIRYNQQQENLKNYENVYYFNKKNKLDDKYIKLLIQVDSNIGSIKNNNLDNLLIPKYEKIATKDSSLLNFIFLAVGVYMICYDYKKWIPTFCQKPENFEYVSTLTTNFYIDKLPKKDEVILPLNLIGKSKIKFNRLSPEILNKILDIQPLIMDDKHQEYKLYDLKPHLERIGINTIYIPDENISIMYDSLYSINDIKNISYCIIDQMVIVLIKDFLNNPNRLYIYGFNILDFLQFLDLNSFVFEGNNDILFFPKPLSNESGSCFEMNWTKKENIVDERGKPFEGIQMGWVKTANNPNCKIETYEWCKHLDYLFYIRYFFLKNILKYEGPILLLDLSRIEYDDIPVSLNLFRKFNGNESIYSKYGFVEIQ